MLPSGKGCRVVSVCVCVCVFVYVAGGGDCILWDY